MRTLLIAIAALLSFTAMAGNRPPVSLRSGPGGSLVASSGQSEAVFGASGGQTAAGEAFYTSLTENPKFSSEGGNVDQNGKATIDVENGDEKYVLSVEPDGSASLEEKAAPVLGTGISCATSNPGLPLIVGMALFYLLRRLLRRGGWRAQASASSSQ
ncbi:hypothetical protein [Stagnimonas aquatica]|uniref:hypothetical protein n=1 Tax=Stagnimonas aquatica TaxID=2689987 RepID=UPI00131506E9|nr:hypothetical protein [Stagnimonas aquatica]